MSNKEERLTFLKNVAHGAVINDHDFAQVGLDLSQVFDVSAIPEIAMLSVVPSYKVLALHLEPIDDGVGVFLHRGCKSNQIIPLTDLGAYIRRVINLDMGAEIPSSKTRHNVDVCAHSTRWGLEVQ